VKTSGLDGHLAAGKANLRELDFIGARNSRIASMHPVLDSLP